MEKMLPKYAGSEQARDMKKWLDDNAELRIAVAGKHRTVFTGNSTLLNIFLGVDDHELKEENGFNPVTDKVKELSV